MALSIHRSALLPYPAPAVFEIVNDVARYPEFLPWCASVEVNEIGTRERVATLCFEARGIRESFTTRNRWSPGRSIELELVSGPFRELAGNWTFAGLGGESGCRVDLSLRYQVSGVRALLGAVFHRGADQMVDAFCRRANALLG